MSDTIPARVRQTVRQRDTYTCQRCGTYLGPFGLYSLHHRRPKGMGGSRRLDTNMPANLVTLCGSATTPGRCHTYVEKHREEAKAEGFVLLQGMNPAEHPVKTYRGWVLFDNEGCFQEVTAA